MVLTVTITQGRQADDNFVELSILNAIQKVDSAINSTRRILFSQRPRNPDDMLAQFHYPRDPFTIETTRAGEVFEQTLQLIREHVKQGLNVDFDGIDCRTRGQFGALSNHFKSKWSAEYSYPKEKHKRNEETSTRSRHQGDLHRHRKAASAMYLTDIVSSGFAQDFSHFAAEVDKTIAALKQQINKLEARLRQEGCMDDDGIQQKENEHWMKEDFISCSCKGQQKSRNKAVAKKILKLKWKEKDLSSEGNYLSF